MDKVVLRYFKVLDKKNRVLIPKAITNIIKDTRFYVELLEDGTIKLIPQKKEKKGE